MPRIAAVTTVTPEHVALQSNVKRRAAEHFSQRPTSRRRVEQIFDHAGVSSRSFCEPLDWYLAEHSWSERAEAHDRHAQSLGTQAVRRLLTATGLHAGQIDGLIVVCSTGISVPSLDAHIANRLDLPSGARRTPLWGLGCAGGATGLIHAADYVEAHPSHRVVLLNIELCSLTFRPHDASMGNIIATALFGDAASAALVVENVEFEGGLKIVGTNSAFYPGTLGEMGWRVRDDGLEVMLGRGVPELVRKTSRLHTDETLRLHGRRDVDAWLLHPGSTRVLEMYEEALELTPEQTALSRDVLSRRGNVSSATVMFILEEYMRRDPAGLAYLSALGPGFSASSILLEASCVNPSPHVQRS